MTTRVLLATNSRDRGSTSRTLEAWTRLLPGHGVTPIVTLGGKGPLLSALRDAGTAAYEHPIRYFFDWRRPAPFLWAIARLAWRIRRSGADLVHVNEHEHYPVVARAARLARVPIVVHIRFKPDAAMCRWLFKAPYAPQRVFFTSRKQMSDSAANVALAVPPDRFRLIYNGLDFDSFGRDLQARARLRAQWGVDDKTVAIGTASSISRRKRLDHIIRLVANLAHAGLPVRGFIAGQPYFEADRQEFARLQKLVTDLGVSHLVTFLGYVEPSEPLYHAWDVCVSTSEYETFGMTMLEAMACGCPVLAYPGGAVAEVVGDGGMVVPDGDLAALTAAAAKLASDPGYRANMGAASRSRAEAFDVRRSVDQLVAEYRAVVSDPSSSSASSSSEAIRSTWLTMNPNLGSSARTLQHWIGLGTGNGMAISVVLRQAGALRNTLRSAGVHTALDPMHWPDRSNFFLSLWHALKIKTWMAREGTQLIHCYEHDLYPFAVALRSVTSLPLVCHIHFTVDRHFTEWAFGSQRKQPDAIIWTSRQQQHDCAPAMEGVVAVERQHVVPLGIDLSKFGCRSETRELFRQRLGIAPDTIVIGSACALRGVKRIDEFLDLVRVLRDRFPNVVGLLAGGPIPGEEAYASAVIPRMRALEKEGRFSWLGHIDPIEPFLHATDVFVSTSEYETFGMSVLEAMACGKPVAAYRGGSVHEVVGSAGLIVETGAKADLLGAIESLVLRRSLREELGAAARQRVADEYDPRRSLEQLRRIYLSLL